LISNSKEDLMTNPVTLRHSIFRALISSMVVLILAAIGGCGGGGGGGGGDSGTGGSTSTRISIASVSGATSEIYDGQIIPAINIIFRVSGDTTIFRTTPLTLVLVLSDVDLFEASPTIFISSDNLGGNLGLTGKLWKAGPTTRTGNITLHACLDSNCAKEIPVDGGTIPYRITINQGVSLPVSSVDLTASFGTFPAERIIPVTLPANTVSWSVSQFFGVNAISASKASDGSNNLVIGQAFATPVNSSLTDEILIRAETADHQTIGTTLTVNLSSTPSTIPAVFQIAHPTFSRVQGQGAISDSLNAGLLFQSPSANSVHYTGTTFTEWPAEATDVVVRESWLEAFMPEGAIGPSVATTQYPISIRVMSCNGFGCLPAGSYKAQLNFEFSPPEGAAAIPMSLPVTMIVTPAP
jgi:hypothetical protein